MVNELTLIQNMLFLILPTKTGGVIEVSFHSSVYLSVCLPVYLSVCLSICVSVCMSVTHTVRLPLGLKKNGLNYGTVSLSS